MPLPAIAPTADQCDYVALFILSCEPEKRERAVADVASAWGDTIASIDPRYSSHDVAAQFAAALHARLRHINAEEGHA